MAYLNAAMALSGTRMKWGNKTAETAQWIGRGCVTGRSTVATVFENVPASPNFYLVDSLGLELVTSNESAVTSSFFQ